MTRRHAATALIPLILAVSACARPHLEAPPASASADDLPQGWRWESFGGVEVGVPGDWGWDNGSQRLSQWCVRPEGQTPQPAVGRPGVSTAAGCPQGEPDPGTLIVNTGSVVAFDRTTDPPGTMTEGDQTAVRLGGVQVAVNAPADLRQRIVATIRPVAEADSYGCPTSHPISARPQQRPVPARELTDVASISACKYRLGRDAYLISSVRLDGSAARQAIGEIGRAPVGGGPDNPDQCLPEVSYGDDAIVLRVRSAGGSSEIYLRYSGCDHNGFDDGTTVRRLTAAAVGPFVARSNTVFSGFSGGPEKVAILMP